MAIDPSAAPKAGQQHQLVIRAGVAQGIVDALSGKALDWGRLDCGRSIVAPVLKGLGHHCPLARFGAYSNEFGARRALARNGFASMEDFLDKRPLMRIGHASLLVADLVGLKAEGDWLGIGVHLGNGRAFAFIETAAGPVGHVIQPREIAAAWRVPCLR